MFVYEYECPTGCVCVDLNLSEAIDQLYALLSIFLLFYIRQGLTELRCRNCLLKELDTNLFDVLQPLIELNFGENYVNILVDRKLYYQRWSRSKFYCLGDIHCFYCFDKYRYCNLWLLSSGVEDWQTNRNIKLFR